MSSKILDRLAKLMAHEESARAIGSAAEAEAFADKIQDLLRQYNLSLTDVERHAALNAPIGGEHVFPEPIQVQEWQKLLLGTIARITGCFAAVSENGMLLITGRETDRKTAVSLFKHFNGVCSRLAKEYEESLKPVTTTTAIAGAFSYTISFSDWTGVPREMRVKSFAFGLVEGIRRRLWQTYAPGPGEHQQQQQQAASEALVFMETRAEQAEKWLSKTVRVEPAERGRIAVDAQSFNQGLSAGSELAMADRILE